MAENWRGNLFKYLFYHNRRGQRLLAPPWEPFITPETKGNLPWFLVKKFPIMPALLVLGSVCVLLGLMIGAATMVMFGVCCFWYIHASLGRIWEQSGEIDVRVLSVPQTVTEGVVWDLMLDVSYRGKGTASCIVVRVQNDGSQQGLQTAVLYDVKQNEHRRVTLKYMANKGPGTFTCHPMFCSVLDDVGLGSFTVDTELRASYKVNLIPLAFPPPKFRKARDSMQMGMNETQRSGSSHLFLGLRDFRPGDSIRFIDWKKTARVGDPIVRETERLAATEAIIFCDDSRFGNMEDEKISASATLRQLAAGVAASLDRGQVPFGFVTGYHTIPVGSGSRQWQMVMEAITEMMMQGEHSFLQMVWNNLASLPPMSAVIIICHSVSLDVKTLEELSLAMNDRGLESLLLVIDSQAFANHVRKNAEFDILHARALAEFEVKLQKLGAYQNIAPKLAELFDRSYMIGPFDHVSNLMTEVAL